MGSRYAGHDRKREYKKTIYGKFYGKKSTNWGKEFDFVLIQFLKFT